MMHAEECHDSELGDLVDVLTCNGDASSTPCSIDRSSQGASDQNTTATEGPNMSEDIHFISHCCDVNAFELLNQCPDSLAILCCHYNHRLHALSPVVLGSWLQISLRTAYPMTFPNRKQAEIHV
jgi:hypothetical protein